MPFRNFRLLLAAVLVPEMLGTPVLAQTLVGDGTLGCGDTYVVQSGDTLGRLAARAYGNSDHYLTLLVANSDTLDNPDLLQVGMEINIPCLDATGDLAAVDIETAVSAEGPLNYAEIEALFGPVALFPDPLLNQILLAVTVPLDVVKAGRFIEESASLTADERSSAAAQEDWDPSVRAIAAAYPDLIKKMSDHIDWTEQAGEAVLAQTDDVLDAIQRLRAAAMGNGYLVDNEAQMVETEGDVITIAPAQPQVIYVPTYDPQVVYSTPVAAAPQFYYGDDDVYYSSDGWDDALAAGAIFLGTAVVLDEIFDDDWDGVGGWDDEDIDVDWDRGEINIDRGDINIDRDIDRDLTNIDRDNVDIGDRGGITTIGGDRTAIGDGDRPALGSRDQLGQARIDADREAARARIEGRRSTDRDVARLPTSRPEVSRSRAEQRPVAGNREAVRRPQAERRPQAQPTRRTRPDTAFTRDARPNRARPQVQRQRPGRPSRPSRPSRR